MATRSLNSTLDRMVTLNRAFDDAFGAANGNGNGRPGWTPALDIVETAESYVVTAELAGVARNSIDIGFEKNVLTIRGEKALTSGAADVRVHAAERGAGKFERTVRLPQFVDGALISAAYADGLLTVTVPKAKAAQPRKIEIGDHA